MTKQLGSFGEGIASQYLAEKGYKIIDKNYYTRHGEIDLICEKNGRIIFVEVKTRTSTTFGFPETAITKKKLRSLIFTAQRYMLNKKQPWQIDVLAITLTETEADIVHFPNCS